MKLTVEENNWKLFANSIFTIKNVPDDDDPIKDPDPKPINPDDPPI